MPTGLRSGAKAGSRSLYGPGLNEVNCHACVPSVLAIQTFPPRTKTSLSVPANAAALMMSSPRLHEE
jgi:hypothetical protein